MLVSALLGGREKGGETGHPCLVITLTNSLTLLRPLSTLQCSILTLTTDSKLPHSPYTALDCIVREDQYYILL